MFKKLCKCLLLFFSVSIANAAEPSKEVQQFIQQMATRHQFSADTLKSWFSKTTPNNRVIELMDKPAENLPWHAYQERVLTDERVKQGIVFLQQNKSLLQKATAQFGIAPEILVAILGVESSYGNITGNFSVFETLATLAFHYPRRADFFKQELAQFLLLSREEGFDPLSIKGSYAGAMGPAQFMPSSYRAYAIDFDENGHRNILDNTPNIIGTIANYFKNHGWQSDKPVACGIQVSGTGYKQFQVPDKNMTYATTINEWKKVGVKINEPTIPKAHKPQPKDVAKLVILEGKEGPALWMAFGNFEVIKRYNNSTHYAMAVHLLGKQIKEGAQVK